MSYAVIEFQGKQYRVGPGQEFVVPFVNGSPGDTVVIQKVLLMVDEGRMTVGVPFVSGRTLKATIVAQKKGEKVRVEKYKAKSRYQKAVGFRSKVTQLRVEGFGRSSEIKAKISTKTKKGKDK